MFPDSNTVWKIEGNKKLTNKNPIKLTWSNSQEIIFEKHISLDNQFLFTDQRQKMINSSDKTYTIFIHMDK